MKKKKTATHKLFPLFRQLNADSDDLQWTMVNTFYQYVFVVCVWVFLVKVFTMRDSSSVVWFLFLFLFSIFFLFYVFFFCSFWIMLVALQQSICLMLSRRSVVVSVIAKNKNEKKTSNRKRLWHKVRYGEDILKKLSSGNTNGARNTVPLFLLRFFFLITSSSGE